jgi:hypothetical protein
MSQLHSQNFQDFVVVLATSSRFQLYSKRETERLYSPDYTRATW